MCQNAYAGFCVFRMPGIRILSGNDNPALGLLGAEHRTPARATCRAPRHLARDSGRHTLMVQVAIDEDGAVTVTLDSDAEAADDESSRLAGLALDDMVDRAASTAIRSWFAIRADDVDVVSGD